MPLMSSGRKSNCRIRYSPVFLSQNDVGRWFCLKLAMVDDSFPSAADVVYSIAVTHSVPVAVHQLFSLAVTYELDSCIVETGYVPGNRVTEGGF
jgi:hypothetical protein